MTTVAQAPLNLVPYLNQAAVDPNISIAPQAFGNFIGRTERQFPVRIGDSVPEIAPTLDAVYGNSSIDITNLINQALWSYESPMTTYFLPWFETTAMHFRGDKFIFNSTMAAPTPYGAPARMTSMRRFQVQFGTERRGMSMMFEANNFNTPEGQKHFNMQILSTTVSMMETQEHDSVLAFMGSQDGINPITGRKYGDYNDEAQNLESVLYQEAASFAAVQKGIETFRNGLAAAKHTIIRRSKKEPRLVAVPPQLETVLSSIEAGPSPAHPSFLRYDADGLGRLAPDIPPLTVLLGMRVYILRSIEGQFKNNTIRGGNALNRIIEIGEHYLLKVHDSSFTVDRMADYTPAWNSTKLFDYTLAEWRVVHAEDVYRASGIWTPDGGLSPIFNDEADALNGDNGDNFGPGQNNLPRGYTGSTTIGNLARNHSIFVYQDEGGNYKVTERLGDQDLSVYSLEDLKRMVASVKKKIGNNVGSFNISVLNAARPPAGGAGNAGGGGAPAAGGGAGNAGRPRAPNVNAPYRLPTDARGAHVLKVDGGAATPHVTYVDHRGVEITAPAHFGSNYVLPPTALAERFLGNAGYEALQQLGDVLQSGMLPAAHVASMRTVLGKLGTMAPSSAVLKNKKTSCACACQKGTAASAQQEVAARVVQMNELAQAAADDGKGDDAYASAATAAAPAAFWKALPELSEAHTGAVAAALNADGDAANVAAAARARALLGDAAPADFYAAGSTLAALRSRVLPEVAAAVDGLSKLISRAPAPAGTALGLSIDRNQQVTVPAHLKHLESQLTPHLQTLSVHLATLPEPTSFSEASSAPPSVHQMLADAESTPEDVLALLEGRETGVPYNNLNQAGVEGGRVNVAAAVDNALRGNNGDRNALINAAVEAVIPDPGQDGPIRTLIAEARDFGRASSPDDDQAAARAAARYASFALAKYRRDERDGGPLSIMRDPAMQITPACGDAGGEIRLDANGYAMYSAVPGRNIALGVGNVRVSNNLQFRWDNIPNIFSSREERSIARTILLMPLHWDNLCAYSFNQRYGGWLPWTPMIFRPWGRFVAQSVIVTVGGYSTGANIIGHPSFGLSHESTLGIVYTDYRVHMKANVWSPEQVVILRDQNVIQYLGGFNMNFILSAEDLKSIDSTETVQDGQVASHRSVNMPSMIGTVVGCNERIPDLISLFGLWSASPQQDRLGLQPLNLSMLYSSAYHVRAHFDLDAFRTSRADRYLDDAVGGHHTQIGHLQDAMHLGPMRPFNPQTRDYATQPTDSRSHFGARACSKGAMLAIQGQGGMLPGDFYVGAGGAVRA